MENQNDNSLWSRNHPSCIECGTTSIPHRSKGLCSTCYQKKAEMRNSSKSRVRNFAASKITREFLVCEYITKGKSLSDIAKELQCSRQYIHKRLKEYEIDRRSLSTARISAYEKGKLNYQRLDTDGNLIDINPVKHIVQEDFFSKWTPEMAYVLGWIFTDGNLDPGRLLDPTRKTTLTIPRLTLALSEKEPIEKVLSLMKTKSTILFRKETHYSGSTQGALYYFHINNKKIYNDLIYLGLKPNKSLTIKFPEIPEEYLRHFIRGCWDGDGSVFLDKKNIIAHFVSGSFHFITGLVKYLTSKDLTDRTIYEINNKKSFKKTYYVKYSGANCYKLFHLLYDNVDSSMFLKRKYNVFKNFFDENRHYD